MVTNHSRLGWVLLALAVAGCSDSGGGSNGPVGGTGGVGTDDDAWGGGGSGAGNNTTNTTAVDCQGATASKNADGILTPFPNIDVSITTAGFQMTTLNFVVTEDGDSRGPLLEMFAELKNTGVKTECDFIPSVYLDGEELVGLPDTPPYFSNLLTTVTNDCIGPGETGALQALARGITKAELAAARSLSVALEPNTYGTVTPATDPPRLTTEIAKLAEGWAVKGSVTPTVTIRNFGLYVFPRNAQGVLFARLMAFPNKLAALSSGVAYEFATDTTACQFTSFELFDKWIVGN